jgi:hypothetical protein
MSETVETVQPTIESNGASPAGGQEEKNEENNSDELKLGKDGKPTLGEELFLVHLSRRSGEPPSVDDFDFESPRKKPRAESIGEELWNVHVRRSQNMEPDLDVDECETTTNKTSNVARSDKDKKRSNTRPKKPARCSERLTKVLHLRNRNVQKKLVS